MFAGDYAGRRAADARGRGRRRARGSAVNDVVVTSSTLGRMIELGWSIGGEDLGVLPCDGLICATPSGLDGVQPLERRAGARLGARRDGGHLRRAALAACAAARRAARPRARRREPDAGRRARPSSSTATRVGGSRAGRPGRRAARRGSAACSRRCRRARSSAATANLRVLGRRRRAIGTSWSHARAQGVGIVPTRIAPGRARVFRGAAWRRSSRVAARGCST